MDALTLSHTLSRTKFEFDIVRDKVRDKVELSFARKAKSLNWGYREDRNPKHKKSENHPIFASYGITVK